MSHEDLLSVAAFEEEEGTLSQGFSPSETHSRTVRGDSCVVQATESVLITANGSRQGL